MNSLFAQAFGLWLRAAFAKQPATGDFVGPSMRACLPSLAGVVRILVQRCSMHVAFIFGSCMYLACLGCVCVPRICDGALLSACVAFVYLHLLLSPAARGLCVDDGSDQEVGTLDTDPASPSKSKAEAVCTPLDAKTFVLAIIIML